MFWSTFPNPHLNILEKTIVVHDVIYAFGAYLRRDGIKEVPKHIVHVFNANSKTWTRLSDDSNGRTPRQIAIQDRIIKTHSLAVYENFVYVYWPCSWTGSGRGGLFCYDVLQNQWSDTILEGPQERTNHAVCSHGDRMYIFGGKDTATDRPIANVLCISLLTGEITTVVTTGEPPIPRQLATATRFHNNIYLVGGVETSFGEIRYCTDLMYLDLTENVWRQQEINDEEPFTTARIYHTTVVYKNDLLVIGGHSDDDTVDVANFAFKYTPMQRCWTHAKMFGEKLPANMFFGCHTATLLGSRLFLFNGNSPTCYVLEMVLPLRLKCLIAVRDRNMNVARLPEPFRLETVQWLADNQDTLPGEFLRDSTDSEPLFDVDERQKMWKPFHELRHPNWRRDRWFVFLMNIDFYIFTLSVINNWSCWMLLVHSILISLGFGVLSRPTFVEYRLHRDWAILVIVTSINLFAHLILIGLYMGHVYIPIF